eukprot:gb/GECG01002384.1/.p1 GENE.gb/GECG01002384.1/~~gb/GECG01002384.1/.p1  ORF type:complete len:105 (+),score=15.90 gb/GECG01002384.1/:1-315(+)
MYVSVPGNGFMSPQQNSGGGGFMSPSSFKQQDENGGGFKQDTSPNSKRFLREKKSLRPITISQLNSVQAKQDGEGFMLDEIDIDQVLLYFYRHDSYGETFISSI